MKFICHRGCRNGPSPRENSPDLIQECIRDGYDVEIDVWLIDEEFYLGHDSPVYKVDLSFFISNQASLWCHCKNLEAFLKLSAIDSLNCFWHQNDDYTLTSLKYVWVFPGKRTQGSTGREVIVMPEWDNLPIDWSKNYAGVCSDYTEKLRQEAASKSPVL